MTTSASIAGMGEPESNAAHQETDGSTEDVIVASSAAKKLGEDGQPQHENSHERQFEHHEADEGIKSHPEPAESIDRHDEDAVTFWKSAQHPSAVVQHASLDPALKHVTDDTPESSTQPSEGVTVEHHSSIQDSQEHDHHFTPQLSAAANGSSGTMSQPVTEESSQHGYSMTGEEQYLSYNGGSAVHDRTVPKDESADQMSEGPASSSEMAALSQIKELEPWDSHAMLEEQGKLQQDNSVTGGEQDEQPTSDRAVTSTAIPEASGGAPDEEAEDNGDDDDWGDDFGTFEEAAEVAAEQPSAQAAEHISSPPMPEVPDPPSDDVEGSQLSELLGASHEEFLKAVSRQLLGPGIPTSGELHNIGSTSIDDSLQHLADQLRSLHPGASELTQKALQIGTKQDAQCVEPIAWAGSDTEAAFLASLPFRQRASDQGIYPTGDKGDSAAGAVSRGPRPTQSQEDIKVSSVSRKDADMQVRGSGSGPAQIRVGMDSSVGPAGGSDNAALRALVQKLPNLSYMLSDTLVPPSRTR